MPTANTNASTAGYTLLKTIALPGNAGGHGDWLTYDPGSNLVWVAQSPDQNVLAIDPTTNTIRGVIPGFVNSNGIAITQQNAFISDAGANVDVIVDKNNFTRVGSVVPTGATPDGTTYVSSTNQVYVASDTANVEDALSATAPFTQTASFTLQPDPSPDGPDVSLYLAATDLLYQPDQGQLDLINPHTNTIVATFPLLASGDTKPPVYDPVTNHLIVGTTNNQMLVIDATSGKLLTTIPISGSVDETGIDVSARLAFVGDKAGVVDVINLDTSQLVGDLPSESGMHTLTVDPLNHDVYVYENNSNKLDVFAPASSVVSTGTVAATVVGGVAQLTGVAAQQATVSSTGGTLTATVNQQTITAGGANEIAFSDGRLYVGATSYAAQVIRLYEAAFGRAPDAAGFASATNFIESGGSVTMLAQGLLSSAEGTAMFAKTGGTANGFVTQVYQNAFHRAPDTAGLNAGVQALSNGSLTQAQYLAGVAGGAEAQADTASQIKTGVWIENGQAAQAESLYFTALNRAPDSAGLVNMMATLANGATMQAMAQGVVSSPEFAKIYGGLGNSDLVTAMYQNALGRAPDTASAAAYTAGLNNGSLSRAGLLLDFSMSGERQGLNIGSQGVGLTRVVPVS